MSELSAPAAILWRARLLDYLDGQAADMVADLADLVRVPSISGSAEENAIQDVLSARLADDGCEVDAWPIPMAETLAAEDFPGVEVERAEAWGTVGRLPGTGVGASLMLNAHVDVVPPGDLDPWGDQVPFSGTVGTDAVYGRGARWNGGAASSRPGSPTPTPPSSAPSHARTPPCPAGPRRPGARHTAATCGS